MNRYKGVILVLLSALGFALMPTFALFAYQTGISVTTLLFIRFALASLLFFLYIFLKEIPLQLTGKDYLSLFLLGGICYNTMSNLYFTSVKYIPAALAVLMLYTYPMIVSILSFLIDRVTPSRKVILSLGISFMGLILVLGSSIATVNHQGVLFALGASFIYSIYIVLGNRIIRKIPSLIATSFITLFSSVGIFLLGLLSGSLSFHFDASAWIWILGLSLFSTILAIFTFFKGMELLGPTHASILSMAEPLFAIIITVVLFQDTITLFQIIGGTAVLFGAFLTAKSQEQHTAKDQN
ncbi:Threonine/homoserine efflux transporter RhtA [Geosporobacter subterraneus DSM 17957]|uniref:Threonine/homoserine efflux transporter RhtA n=1 Tax=Geosporobacter subterraneus DSM 17957 TaxID=1121919 RepID=A0A1M6QFS7_9FIRM|nr:DMT family transporter [Geosporobacter subterraneus]SHK18960.1 Threonine/homoserine efflux transporter RhtA [Geosporobacter subterraneus DSM 17957]